MKDHSNVAFGKKDHTYIKSHGTQASDIVKERQITKLFIYYTVSDFYIQSTVELGSF